MIDIHTHVLPGIDDGPPDLVGSLELARAAAAAGTATLVATPHVRADHPAVVPDELAGRAAEVEAAARDAGIALAVLPGAEVAASSAVELSDAELRAASLGGNGHDILLETPYGELPTVLAEIVEDLARRGFRVTLAHPERNPDIQARPERLGELVARGALVQVTAASVLAGRRSASRRAAVAALRSGWVHALATDAHRAGARTGDLGPAADAAAAVAGGVSGLARWLVHDVPAAIVSGSALPPRPAAPRRTRFLRR